MPGKFSPPPRVSDPGMHHGTCVTHVPWCMPGSLTNDFLWSRRRGKRSRHSRRMRKPQFYLSSKRPIEKPFCSDSPLQDCGAVILTNVSGIIQSPDFLNHHPSTTFCTWTIQVNATVVGWQLKSSRCWANVLNFMISQDMLLYEDCMTVPHKWTIFFWLATAN